MSSEPTKAAPAVPGLRTHVPELDGIRGVAVSFVVLYHLYRFGHIGEGTVFGSVFSLGWSGVDLFFVLSGLLITGILLDSKIDEKYFQRFYARRILRIFPLYYATVAFLFVVAPFILRHLAHRNLVGLWADPGSQIYAWTFTLNILAGLNPDRVSTLFYPLWSLSIEEQFYIAWPLVVYLLSVKHLRIVCFSLICTAPAIRMCLVIFGKPLAAYLLTLCRVDALAMGALLALTLRTPAHLKLLRSLGWSVMWASLCAVVAIVLLRGTHFDDPIVLTLGLSLLGVFYAAGIVTVLGAPAHSASSRIFCARPLLVLGKYSYAIYIFHQAIIIGMTVKGVSVKSLESILHSSILAAVAFSALAVTASLSAAIASWWLIEKRFLSLKRLFSY